MSIEEVILQGSGITGLLAYVAIVHGPRVWGSKKDGPKQSIPPKRIDEIEERLDRQERESADMCQRIALQEQSSKVLRETCHKLVSSLEKIEDTTNQTSKDVAVLMERTGGRR